MSGTRGICILLRISRILGKHGGGGDRNEGEETDTDKSCTD